MTKKKLFTLTSIDLLYPKVKIGLLFGQNEDKNQSQDLGGIAYSQPDHI